MTPDTVIVTITGICAIVAVYWFFFMKSAKSVKASGEIDITVDGGYHPESIVIPKGVKTTLKFMRKDPSSCLEEVVIDEFHVRKYLPLNKQVSIAVTPKKAGTFPFSCGMNMFHGTLIVE